MEVFILFFSLILCSKLVFCFYHNIFLEKYVTCLCGVYLFLIAGLRDVSVGIDTMTYYNAFYYQMPKSTEDIIAQYGILTSLFWHIAYMIRALTDEYQILLFCSSAFSIGIISKYIQKYSPDKMLSFLFFSTCGFFAIGLHLVRQYIAIAIAVYSFNFIRERRFFFFLICILIGVLIHPSIALFFPAYFIAYKRITLKNSLIYIFCIILSFFIGEFMIDTFSMFLFNGRYNEILNLDKTGQNMFFVYIVILLVGFSRLKVILKQDIKNTIYYNFLWMTLVIQSMSFVFSIASRVAYMYSIFLIVFIPKIICSYKNPLMRYGATALMIFGCLTAYFYKFYNLNEIYPYKFFFE